MASLPMPAASLTRLSPPLGSRFAGCRIVPPLGCACLTLPPRAFNVSGALPATWMTARANMPDDARTAVMGHTSITMTMRYTHRDTASLGRLMADAIPSLHDDAIDAEIIDDEPEET